MIENRFTEHIIGAAIEVHKTIGPGRLEAVYEECMTVELGLRDLRFHRQKPVHPSYKGHRLIAPLKVDLLVEEEVVVELKAVESLLPVHSAQLLTYLRLTDLRLGPLINFNVPQLSRGVKRVVNGFERPTFQSSPAHPAVDEATPAESCLGQGKT